MNEMNFANQSSICKNISITTLMFSSNILKIFQVDHSQIYIDSGDSQKLELQYIPAVYSNLPYNVAH